MKRFRVLLSLALLIAAFADAGAQEAVSVGSKKFTESYVLGEIAKRALEDAGFAVNHRQGMGATGIVWEALRTGQISTYPEYTGTISEEILKTKRAMTVEELRAALRRHGVGLTEELGFNDTYALAMRRADAERLGIRSIGDLRNHPDLRVAVTHEFLNRSDGWKPLSQRYGLAMRNVRGVEHALGYEALLAGETDIKDAYSTDAKLADARFLVLKDDLGFFPKYNAVFLYRLEMPEKAVQALQTVEGTIDEARMIGLNAEAERTKDYARAAAGYFQPRGQKAEPPAGSPLARNLARWTGEHLRLVALSMLAAILAGIPLGIAASRPGPAGQLILGTAGVIQTIPSLALLALLVPIRGLGISERTAILALFLYSLLPIVRNTATGLRDIPPGMREAARALGLAPWARMRRVYLPMASRSILAGVQTSAVINVGTATLAALIGAGGYGEPIISGISLNDNATILQGAVPAAVLAILVQVAFEGLDRLIIPRGLRLRPPGT
jgi:osmoprotectant transport system permease protein